MSKRIKIEFAPEVEYGFDSFVEYHGLSVVHHLIHIRDVKCYILDGKTPAKVVVKPDVRTIAIA